MVTAVIASLLIRLRSRGQERKANEQTGDQRKP